MTPVPVGGAEQDQAQDGVQATESASAAPRSNAAAELLGKAVAALLERCKALQETAAVFSARLKSEGDSLGEEAIALEREVRQQRKGVSSAVERGEISAEQAEQLEDDLLRARSMVYEGDISAVMPHKANGVFLSLFLGPVNVKSARRDVRFKVKEEYNSYRDRTAVLFLTFPLLFLLCKSLLKMRCIPGLPVRLYQAWLLFFYTSLALRENILRINGSDIRPWWIRHHYFAICMALVSLTWGIEGPDCEQKQVGISWFLQWAVMQGIAMLLQNRYQRARLYTRIALGKAGRMDVVWGETAAVKGQLWLLYPLLFVLQGFQFYIGAQLLHSSFFGDFEWQMLTCGMLLIIMAFGNFTNTVATVMAKSAVKAKMRKKGESSKQANATASKSD